MGNAESQPVRNVDKRTARRDHASIFEAAVQRFKQALAEAEIAGVVAVSQWYPELDGVFTLACTEKVRPEHIQRLAQVAAASFQMEVAL